MFHIMPYTVGCGGDALDADSPVEEKTGVGTGPHGGEPVCNLVMADAAHGGKTARKYQISMLLIRQGRVHVAGLEQVPEGLRKLRRHGRKCAGIFGVSASHGDQSPRGLYVELRSPRRITGGQFDFRDISSKLLNISGK